jgi:hypothetical protein
LAGDTAQPLFQSHETLALTLEADFSSIDSDRNAATSPYRPAVLSYRSEDGQTQSLSLQVKTRGDFRLKRENCSFLALMLNFRGSDTAGTPFAGQRDMPLVTHCRRKPWYEQYVVREYLAYRSFNLITDESLRVRLARITYLESGGDSLTTRYAFLVEHFDAMTQRLGADIVHGNALATPTATGFDFGILYMFQLLIGNTDFSVAREHNILLLQIPDGRIIPVPYDLDFSGAVDAHYAITPRFLTRGHLDLRRSVKIRRYRGFCEPADVLEQAVDYYRDRKAPLYALYQGQEGLTDKSRKKSLNYLDSFFAMLESRSELQETIRDGCW